MEMASEGRGANAAPAVLPALFGFAGVVLALFGCTADAGRLPEGGRKRLRIFGPHGPGALGSPHLSRSAASGRAGDPGRLREGPGPRPDGLASPAEPFLLRDDAVDGDALQLDSLGQRLLDQGSQCPAKAGRTLVRAPLDDRTQVARGWKRFYLALRVPAERVWGANRDGGRDSLPAWDDPAQSALGPIALACGVAGSLHRR